MDCAGDQGKKETVMSGDARRGDFAVEDVDFDAFYRGQPVMEGVEVAFDVPPGTSGRHNRPSSHSSRRGACAAPSSTRDAGWVTTRSSSPSGGIG
jgi:hypothetical protein